MEDNKKKFYTNLFIGGTLCFLSIFSAYELSSVIYEGENYIASVNNRYITVSEFKEAMKAAKTQQIERAGMDFKTEKGASSYSELRKNIMKELIFKKILMQNAAQENIVISDSMVESEIDRIKAQQFYNNQSAFEAALKKNDLSLEQLKNLIRERMTIQKYNEKLVNDNVKVTDDDVRQYYREHQATFVTPEQVEAAHILVSDEQKAKDIREQITSGKKSFAALAEEFSMDPGSKENGGQLGYFGRGQMVPEFEKTAFNLKVGQISEPVKTQFGYHIIKVTGHRPEKISNFEDVKDELAKQMLGQKQNEFFQNWMKETMDSADVTYNPWYSEYTIAEKAPESEEQAMPEGEQGSEEGSENPQSDESSSSEEN